MCIFWKHINFTLCGVFTNIISRSMVHIIWNIKSKFVPFHKEDSSDFMINSKYYISEYSFIIQVQLYGLRTHQQLNLNFRNIICSSTMQQQKHTYRSLMYINYNYEFISIKSRGQPHFNVVYNQIIENQVALLIIFFNYSLWIRFDRFFIFNNFW